MSQSQQANQSPETAKAEAMPISRKVLNGIIAVLTIAVLVLIGQAIINLNEKPETKKRTFNTLAVMATPALQEDVKLTVDVQGEARPQIEIDLVPQVGGKIIYVSPNFIDGGIFQKGEVLVRIDPSDYNVNIARVQSAVAQAEQVLAREQAEAAIARRDYEELGIGGTPVRLALTDADLSKLNLPVAYVAENRASAPSVMLSAVMVRARPTAYRLRRDCS